MGLLDVTLNCLLWVPRHSGQGTGQHNMELLNLCRKVTLSKDGPLLQTARHMSTSLKSVKVSVDGRSIHVVRRGNGPKAVLLMPGALGTATTDMLPQIEGLCPRTFSLVGWDPPGYGESRPPARDFKDFLAFQGFQCWAGVMEGSQHSVQPSSSQKLLKRL